MYSYTFINAPRLNRRQRTVHISMRFAISIPRDELSEAIQIVLHEMLTHLHPLSEVSISTVEVQDIPENIDHCLMKIGPLVHFRLHVYFGNRRRRRTRSVWSKRPIKQFALISIGKLIEEKGIVYYCDFPVWFTFKKNFMKQLLSGSPLLYNRMRIFL